MVTPGLYWAKIVIDPNYPWPEPSVIRIDEDGYVQIIGSDNEFTLDDGFTVIAPALLPKTE